MALRLGIAGGGATPALAARLGGWAAEPAQRQGLERLRHDHGVQGACPTLRTRLGRLRTGMGAQRQAAHVDTVVSWRPPARAAPGRFLPTRSVGRDGVTGPLRHGEWQEGATATGSGWERRGTRVGPGSRGQRPAAGPPTWTAPWTARSHALLRQVESQRRRWVEVREDGYHPRDASHRVVQPRTAPKRPWRPLAWIRLGDSYHAGLYITQ